MCTLTPASRSRRSCPACGPAEANAQTLHGHRNQHDVLRAWTMTHLVVVPHRSDPSQTGYEEPP